MQLVIQHLEVCIDSIESIIGIVNGGVGIHVTLFTTAAAALQRDNQSSDHTGKLHQEFARLVAAFLIKQTHRISYSRINDTIADGVF